MSPFRRWMFAAAALWVLPSSAVAAPEPGNVELTEVRTLLREVSEKLSRVMQLLGASSVRSPSGAAALVPAPPTLTPTLARAAKLLAQGWPMTADLRRAAAEAGFNSALIDWNGSAAVVTVRLVLHALPRKLLAPLLKNFVQEFPKGIGASMKPIMEELGIP